MNKLNQRLKKLSKRFLPIIALAGATWTTLMCWALPMSATCILGFFAALLFLCAGPKKGLLSVIVFIMATFTAEFVIRMPLVVSQIYVSPFEILNHYDHDKKFIRLTPNTTISMRQPFGDLVAFSPGNPAIPRVPRNVRWETDSLGFRNSREFLPEDWILIGDSYTMGTGLDQEHAIANQLNKNGLPSYALAGPGALGNYVNYLNYARRNLNPPEFRTIVFFFEGNDFFLNDPSVEGKQSSLESESASAFSKWLSPVKNRFGLTRLRLYRTCFLLRTGNTKRQLTLTPTSQRNDGVFAATVRGIPIAFLRDHARAACRPAMSRQSPEKELAVSTWSEALNSMKPELQLVVFIPEKYRIYKPFLDLQDSTNQPLPLTNANESFLREVCDTIHLPLLNLTPFFEQAAKTALDKTELLYWPDDTHWNGAGVAVAAAQVSEFMKSQQPLPPPAVTLAAP